VNLKTLYMVAKLAAHIALPGAVTALHRVRVMAPRRL
jgi:hypothetical protein